MTSIIEWLGWLLQQLPPIFHYSPPRWVHLFFIPLLIFVYPIAYLAANKIPIRSNRLGEKIAKKFLKHFEWKYYLIQAFFYFWYLLDPEGGFMGSIGFTVFIIYIVNVYFILAVLYTAIRDVRAEQEDAPANTHEGES